MDEDYQEIAELLKNFKYLLEKHKLKEIEDLFEKKLRHLAVTNMEAMWGIKLIICQRLMTLNKYRFKTFGLCKILLIQMAKRGNPKELLLGFLSELENGVFEKNSDKSSDESSSEKLDIFKKNHKYGFDNCVKLLLMPLIIVMNKMPSQRERNLKCVLGIISFHLIQIPQPLDDLFKQSENEDQSKIDIALQRFNFLLPDYINFLSEFVDQYSEDQKLGPLPPRLVDAKLVLLKALFYLLYHPFMFLNLKITKTSSETFKNSNNKNQDLFFISNMSEVLITEIIGENKYNQNFKTFALKILNLISKIESNIFELYELENLLIKEDKDCNLRLTESILKYAFGVQAYIAFVFDQEIENSLVPAIYSPSYVFQKHVKYIIPLLERSESNVREKGLLLVEKLIFRVPDKQLKYFFLDFLKENPLDKALIKIMQYSSIQKHRQLSYKIYSKIITMFDNVGRYHFLFKTIGEPNQFLGIRDLMLIKYKDFLRDEDNNEHFIGINLQNFIRLVVDQLQCDNEDFDIIENIDTIMGFLNLVRFLFIWDKTNKTSIWDERNLIEKKFMSKLKKKITLTRNYFKIKINRSDELNLIKDFNFKIDFNIANDKETNLNDIFGKISKEEEIALINQCLTNIDMIESVLERLNEILLASK